MREVLSERWSRQLRTEDAEKATREPRPVGPPPASADSSLDGCLPAQPPSAPAALWVPYSNLEVTPTPSKPHAFPLGPSPDSHWHHFPGGHQEDREQEEGTFVQAPGHNRSSGQGQAEGLMPSPLPSVLLAP